MLRRELMSLQDRENNRRSNIVGSLIGGTIVDSTIESNKKGINNKADKEVYKPKSYYLSDRLYKAVGLQAALTGLDKSAIVRSSLTIYLKDILEKYSDALK
jgi:hypothetical protein